MQSDPNVQADGILNSLGGVDTGRDPSLLAQNQLSFGGNLSLRGGMISQRPGFNLRTLVFDDTEAKDWFEQKNYQGEGNYRDRAAVMVGGRTFLVNIREGFKVKEITPTGKIDITVAFITPPVGSSLTITLSTSDKIEVGYPVFLFGGKYNVTAKSSNTITMTNINGVPGVNIAVATEILYSDPNPKWVKQAWFQEVEDNLVVQDGVSRAIIYDGFSRRSNPEQREVPTGTVMAYGMGRLWVAVNGREFVAGDINNGPTSPVRFTENDFLNEGGKFIVPESAGDITGMAFIANLDTSLGQGPLQIFTKKSIISINAPVDRDSWKNLQNPIQTQSGIQGALSQTSIVSVNGDLFYVSRDGLRSFFLSRREFGTWGNTPVSREMSRVMADDEERYLYNSSAVLFDNRLLYTLRVRVDGLGNYYEGIGSLDFEPLASMGQKLNPIYDGVWTGIDVRGLFTIEVNSQHRCFAFVRDTDGLNEMWEISKNDKFDNNGGRIKSFFESKAFSHESEFEQNKVKASDIWYDDLVGEVDFDIKYRPDNYDCWYDWATWRDCQTMRQCTFETNSLGCSSLILYKPGFRPRQTVPEPAWTDDDASGQPANLGYSFQVRLEWEGHARVRRLLMKVIKVEESPSGKLVC